MRRCLAAIVVILGGWTAHLQAAEVTGLAAGGREVFVHLEPGERLQPGARVPVGRTGQMLEVVDVVGPRARLLSAEPLHLRQRDRLELPRTVTPVPADAQATPGRHWQVAPAPPAERVQVLERQARTWQAARALRPWIDDARTLGRAPPTRIAGDVSLVGVALHDRADDATWGLLRLGNRLDVQGIAGSDFAWRHDLAAWLDHAGGVPGSAMRRTWQVRQAELAWGLATRPLAATLGRTWAPEGAGAGSLDGSTLRWRLGSGLEALVFGGFLPSIASTAFDAAAWRVGAAVQGSADSARWRSWSQASWSVARQGRAWDRHLLGLATRVDHVGLGALDLELELAAGAVDLTGTAWAGSPVAGGSVRPVRGLVHWLGPDLAGWRPRLRYAYYRAEATRELAWTLPLPAWSASRYHQLYGAVDAPRLGRVELQAAGWGSATESTDPWEGWRWGTSLRARLPQWPAPAWSWSALATGQSGTTLSGGSIALASEWLASASWRWHARLRYAVDRVETTGIRSDAVDARAGFDWGRSPWLVGLTCGARQTLGSSTAVDTDWLDGTFVLSRRL